MFDSIVPVVTFLFSQVSSIFVMMWDSGWMGVALLCVPLILWVVDIFFQIF